MPPDAGCFRAAIGACISACAARPAGQSADEAEWAHMLLADAAHAECADASLASLALAACVHAAGWLAAEQSGGVSRRDGPSVSLRPDGCTAAGRRGDLEQARRGA